MAGSCTRRSLAVHVAAMVFATLLTVSSEAQQRVFRLVKIEVHPSKQEYDLVKDNRDGTFHVENNRNRDGAQRYVVDVNPREGTATTSYINGGTTEFTANIRWSVPPESIASGQQARLGGRIDLRALAGRWPSGDTLRMFKNPVYAWKAVGEAQGKSPFASTAQGQIRAVAEPGKTASSEGYVNAVLQADEFDEWSLSVGLAGTWRYTEITYHYKLATGDEPPPDDDRQPPDDDREPPDDDRQPPDDDRQPPDDSNIPGDTSCGCNCAPAPGSMPGDPCLDPNVQRCIDEWIARAMAVANRRNTEDPGPNGPWRVNQYGILVGHGVRPSSGPHDEWRTTYRSSKYCYMWETWTESHRADIFGGEVPPIREYVTNCYGRLPTATPAGAGGPGAAWEEPARATNQTLQAGYRLVAAGEVVNVPVWIIGANNLAGLNFTMRYDPAVAVPAGDVVKGPVSPQFMRVNPAERGLIRFGFAQGSGIRGTGVLCYIPFRAVGRSGMETDLLLNLQDSKGPDRNVLAMDRMNGCIRIIDPNGRRPGDCEGGPELGVEDALCALEMSVGLRPVGLYMDIDGDGRVLAGDAVIILQLAALGAMRRGAAARGDLNAGADRDFPFVAQSPTTPEGENARPWYDVDLFASPAYAQEAPKRKPRGKLVKISADATTGAPKSEVLISISIETGTEIVALETALTYDPELLELQTVEPGPLLGDDGLLEYNADVPGSVGIALVTIDGFQGEGAIADATFTVKGKAGASCPLRIVGTRAFEKETRFRLPVEESDSQFTISGSWPWWWLVIGLLALLVVVAALARLRKGSKTPPASAGPAKATCPACGAAVAAGAKFCPECGGKLPS